MTLEQIALSLLTGGGIVAIWTIVKYFIDRRKENRQGRKNENKTEADTLKSLAEAYSIKTGAEIQIAQQWQKLAAELRGELDEERKECDLKMEKMQLKINELKKEVEKLKQINTDKNITTDTQNP